MKNLKLILLLFSFFFTLSSVAQKKRRPVPTLPPKNSTELTIPEKNLERVDPHGIKNVKPSFEQAKSTNGCLICHSIQESTLKTKTTVAESCFSCHNHSPHSGIEEHLKNKISCTDCHSPHRGNAIEPAPSSGLFNSFKNKEIESGLIEKKASSPMLKKNCTECHKI